MSLATYWMLTPLALIGLSGFGWLALWLTRHHALNTQHQAGSTARRP
ncbi:MAG TPA: hypothetical protein VGG99_22470 [Acetobacteraceae bacterium]|jgi:hypothetical protein